MVKRLIGSDTTGSDGSVSIPYVGTGAGVVNLSVETEIDGSIVSETYEVLDCIKYDKGLKGSGNHNDIWNPYNLTLTRDAEYSIVSETTVGTNGQLYCQAVQSHDIRIEFDFYQVDGVPSEFFYGFYQNNAYKNGGSLAYLRKTIEEWVHIIIELPSVSGKHLLTCDGRATPVERSMTWDTSSNINFAFWTPSNNSTVRFKNWKCYPI